MQIRRARKEDLPAIQFLVRKYGSKFVVTPSHINKRDIAIVAYAPSGACVGFIWAGLMCKNEIAYVDLFTVDPEYSKKGVGQALLKAVFKACSKVGAKEGFGVIRRDEWHDKSAMNCLKIAGMASKYPYTYIHIDKANSLSEIKDLLGD